MALREAWPCVRQALRDADPALGRVFAHGMCKRVSGVYSHLLRVELPLVGKPLLAEAMCVKV